MPSISTNRTTRSHLSSLNIKENHDILRWRYRSLVATERVKPFND